MVRSLADRTFQLRYKELQSFAPTYLADLQRLEAAKWKCAVLRHLTAKCLDYTDVHGGKDGPLTDMLQGSEALDAALAGLQASLRTRMNNIE